MAELSDLIPATRADVIEGYILAKFRLCDYGECEAEWKRRHLAVTGEAAKDLPPDIRDRLLSAALADIASGMFSWGRIGFDAQAYAAESLPFLVWMCLKIKQPQIKQDDAAALITEGNQAKVQRAVLEMMDYKFNPKKGKAPAGTTDQGGTGAQSSESSDEALKTETDSPQTKSAA